MNLYFIPEIYALTTFAEPSLDNWMNHSDDKLLAAQASVDLQVSLEDYFARIASIQKKDTLIVSENGIVEILARFPEGIRDQVLESNKWTLEDIRDNRYDAVLHMVTAANGAEEFYHLTRSKVKSPEDALDIDRAIQKAWNGHPDYTLITNFKERTFKEKIEETYKQVCRAINRPSEKVTMNKYLITTTFDFSKIPTTMKSVFSETISMLPSGDESIQYWIKKRENKSTGNMSYSFAQHIEGREGKSSIEMKHTLSSRRYNECLAMIDKSKSPVFKLVVNFIIDSHNYVVETFRLGNSTSSVSLLLKYPGSPVPDFIETGKDVTDDEGYQNFRLASDQGCPEFVCPVELS